MSDDSVKKTPTTAKPARVLVSGDFGHDYDIYISECDDRKVVGLHPTRFSCSAGGAAIIYRMLAQVRTELRRAGRPSFDVKFAANSKDKGATSFPAAAVWRPDAGGNMFKKSAARAWRVAQSLGLGEAIGISELPKAELPPFAGHSFRPDILVLEDDAGKFRFNLPPSCWPSVLTTKGTRLPQLVVLKMTAPVCQGDLWWHVTRKGSPLASKLVVVLPIGDLRREDVRISKGISWERTAQDVVREIRQSPVFARLLSARHIVVTLRSEGAVWMTRSGRKWNAILIFDPLHMEDEWNEKAEIDGTAYGFMSAFTAALAARVALGGDPKQAPDIGDGIRSGLRAMRLLRLLGHGVVDQSVEPAFPMEALAQSVVRQETSEDPNEAAIKLSELIWLEQLDKYGKTEIPDPDQVAAVATGSKAKILHDKKKWRILEHADSADGAATRPVDEPLYGAARRVALYGTSALTAIPLAQFGKFLTVDRDEIEALRNISKLIRDYKDKGKAETKPLSLAVFGPPGAGKSFAIKQIAEGIFGTEVPILEFNLSQFDDMQDLIGAFHQVRDKALEGHIPVVFWDEFDSGKYKWLQYLLAPMQDGKFQQGQLTHPIGKCVFIFAGATSYDFENFGPRVDDAEEWSDFKLLKGPDFTSRLHGYLNVLGPNRRQSCRWKAGPNKSKVAVWTEDPSDICFPVRRAVLLRAVLGYMGKRRRDRLEMDHGLLAAMLETPGYSHGARSLERIANTLCLSKDCSFQRSDLPADEVVAMNLDVGPFMQIASQDEAFQRLAEDLAPAVHGFYLGLPKITPRYKRSYVSLPEPVKMDNVAAALRIPWILSLAGLYLAEGARQAKVEADTVHKLIQANLHLLAQEEHHLWMAFRIKNGWQAVETKAERNDDLKKHNCLKPFEALSEEDQNKDCNSVLSFPAMAKLAGYRVVPKMPGHSARPRTRSHRQKRKAIQSSTKTAK